MISIESATTPHSFNSHLLLLLLPHPKTPRIDKFNAFIISMVKIMNVPLDFFFSVERAPAGAPEAPGAQTSLYGAQIEKIYNFSFN